MTPYSQGKNNSNDNFFFFFYLKPQWEVAQHFSTAEKDFRIEGGNQTFSDEGKVGKFLTCRSFLKNKVSSPSKKDLKSETVMY